MTHSPPTKTDLLFVSPDSNLGDDFHSSETPLLADENKNNAEIQPVLTNNDDEYQEVNEPKNYSTFNNKNKIPNKSEMRDEVLFDQQKQFAHNIAIQKTYENENLKNKEWFLTGKITIFMYAFVTCLILHYFPVNPYSYNKGWMRFSFTINILACITGACVSVSICFSFLNNC